MLLVSRLPVYLKAVVLFYWWAVWRRKHWDAVVSEFNRKYFPVNLTSSRTLPDGSIQENEIFYALCCQEPIQLIEVPGYNFRRLGGGFLAYSHSIWKNGGASGWVNSKKILPSRYLYTSGLPHQEGWF